MSGAALVRRGALLAGVLLAGWLVFVTATILVQSQRTSAGPADTAIILGAGLRGQHPSPVFEERIKHAIALYRRGQVDKLLFTGGLGEGAARSEAAAARAYAVARGVPATDILIEEQSRTTHENLQQAGQLMRPAGLRTALIVSDPLHLPRAMRMSRNLGLSARPSPTPTTRYRSWHTKLPFLAREVYFTNHYLVTGN